MPLDGSVYNKEFAFFLYSTIILGVVGISIDSCSESKAAEKQQGIEEKVDSKSSVQTTTELTAEQNDLSLFLQNHLFLHYKGPSKEKTTALYPENPAVLPSNPLSRKRSYKRSEINRPQQKYSKKDAVKRFNPGTWTKAYMHK